jgi:rare lipoprotein A (peptidoglycan hydrolase)
MDPKKNMLKNIKAKAVKSMKKKIVKKAKGGSINKTEGKTTSGVTSSYGPGYKGPVTSTGPKNPVAKIKKSK